jgi:hypothetical protein
MLLALLVRTLARKLCTKAAPLRQPGPSRLPYPPYPHPPTLHAGRAIKHLHELTQLQQAGVDGGGQRVRCAVLFVVNRADCSSFRPCHEADMLFANVLRRAELAGVLVLAHDVAWSAEDGRALLGKRLPVRYGEGVTGLVDEEHLQRVLKFNATDPRTHWKAAKKKQG